MHRDDRDIYNKPGHLIRRLQQIAVAIFISKTEGFDITPVQYAALLALNNHPGIDQTTLMRIIAFDRSTIGEVIGRLAAKGLVKRAVGRNDRRTRRLEITPAGRRLLAALHKINDDVRNTILTPLAPAERRQFVRLLHKLVEQNNEYSRAPLKSQTAKCGERT